MKQQKLFVVTILSQAELRLTFNNHSMQKQNVDIANLIKQYVTSNGLSSTSNFMF